MGLVGLKRGELRLQGGGAIDQPVTFYTVTETQDGTGAVVRSKTKAYDGFVGVAPYQASELRADLREIGETWSVLHMRYHKSRVPVEGMRVVIKLTGEDYEIRGVEHVDFKRTKLELTCRLVR